MSSFPMGRVSRRPARMDLVATLQLMPLAHAVQASALGESAAKIAYRCGLNAGDAEALREHLVKPSWAWIKLRLPSVGRKLKADDLISLERIFDRVFNAMSRSPTASRYAAIRTFSQALTGPLPPSRGSRPTSCRVHRHCSLQHVWVRATSSPPHMLRTHA